MNPNFWAGAATPLTMLTSQAVTTETSSTAIDTTDYTGSALILLESAAGTSDTLTTNGTFASDTGWAKGTGWAIGSGKADCDGTQTTTSDLEQNQTLTAGVSYTLTYTISSYSAGTLTPRLGGTAGTARSADGTYTEIIVCGSGTDPKLEFRADADFVGKIDDVSVIAANLLVKIQESDDDATYADVTGATFSKVYGVASIQKLVLPMDSRKQYIKAVATPAGASASFTCAIQFLGRKATT